MSKKFLFTISHATSSPMEPIAILKIASNMKAFEDDAEIVLFLLGEGVQLAKKSVAASISMELEGATANVGEMLEMAVEIGIRVYACHGFMPGFGVAPGGPHGGRRCQVQRLPGGAAPRGLRAVLAERLAYGRGGRIRWMSSR